MGHRTALPTRSFGKSAGLLAALTIGLVAGHAASAQSLRVEPATEVLTGDPVRITAHGLSPGESVTLRSERWYTGVSLVPRPPRLFRAEIRIRADAEGRLDLDRDAPVSGSYEGVDPRGLFWSMRPVDATPPGDDVDTSRVSLRLQRDSGATVEAGLRLVDALPQVVMQRVSEMPGAVFARLPGAAKLPALIVLGGSEGGSSITDAAAPFASHGFAVLALPYYSPADAQGVREIPNLPEGMVEMPVEFLDQAYAWLAARDDVDATRIGLHGTSLGGTFALLAGVHLDWVDAIVANVPSDVVFDGWGPGIAEGERSSFSVQGKPLPFVPLIGYEQEVERAGRGLDVRIRRPHQRGRAARPDLAVQARIPVERIRGELMLVGAYDDQMWPSGEMVQRLAERRIEAGLPVTSLVFVDAGHSLYETGYSPTTPYRTPTRLKGGSPEANARAQAEIWPTTLDFLQKALGVRVPEREPGTGTDPP